MNAVTTAEYVVLYERTIENLQSEMNSHAQQGYRVVQFSEVAENNFEDGHFTAVMIKAEPTPADLLWYQGIVRAQRGRIEELEKSIKSLTYVTGSLQKRVEEIEDKIDWSK